MNYLNPSRKQDKEGFPFFVKALSNISHTGSNYCFLCNHNLELPVDTYKLLYEKWKTFGDNKDNGFETFLKSIQGFSYTHSVTLRAAFTKFPNSYWNLKHSNIVCPLCSFLIIHHHLGIKK